MKNPQTKMYWIIALCIIGFLLTIADFMALTDIYHDFIGTRILEQLKSPVVQNLPGWTSTPGEWGILRISFLYKIFFFGFCAYVMIRLANTPKRDAQFEK